MKPSIIVSQKDLAGMKIKEVLIELHGFKETTETFQGSQVCMKEGIKLYTLRDETIHSEGVDREVEGDMIIFATRHSSESGKKCLTVHVPGNWNKAEAGGQESKLCTAIPSFMKEAIRKIETLYADDEFDIVQEATHHGPYLEKPCMFIEIGSTPEEWQRTDVAEVIAGAVNHLVINKVKKYKSVIVLGGGHYNSVATKLMLNTEYAVGHICPKFSLPDIDEDMIRQAVEKNGNNFEMVVLDWKGLGTDKARLVELLENTGVKYERYQKLEK